MRVVRWPVVALFVGFLVFAWLLDPAPPRAEGGDARSIRAESSVADTGATSDVWFCAGGTGAEGAIAEHRVFLANVGPTDRSIVVTAHANRGSDGVVRPPVKRLLKLGAYGRIDVKLAELQPRAAYVAATIEIDGGGVLVEHAVTGSLGFDRAPCASTTSDHWFVPLSITATDKAPPARGLLFIYNPYRDDAVVDIFFSNAATTQPAARLAQVVNAQSVEVVDLNVAAPVSPVLATTVRARTGRVVVDRVELLDDPKLARDLVLSAGVPFASDAWVFPSGRLAANRRERLVVFNPSADRPVDVDVEIRPDDPALVIEPLTVAVLPGRQAEIDLSAEPRLATAPGLAGYSVVVRSPDGPIVAERYVTVVGGQPGAGASSTTGATHGARTVYLDGGAGNPNDPAELAVFNPNRRAIARVTFELIADGKRTPAAVAFELQPGERRSLPFAALAVGAYVVAVNATAPVMVEREAANNNVRSAAIGSPERRSAVVVDVIRLNLGE